MDSDVPRDWDRLDDTGSETASETDRPPDDDRPAQGPSLVTLVGGPWGDLASLLAVCTAAMATLVVLGYRDSIMMLPWALALAVLWWAAAAAILLVVRHGTPGMLLAGVAFAGPVPRGRIGWVLLTALVLSCTLGLPAFLGASRSPLRLVAGVDLTAIRGRPGELD